MNPKKCAANLQVYPTVPEIVSTPGDHQVAFHTTFGEVVRAEDFGFHRRSPKLTYMHVQSAPSRVL